MIHGACASMQNTDAERQIKADVARLFVPESWGSWGLPHFVICSEANRAAPVRGAIEEAADRHGWFVTDPPRTDVVILLRPDLHVVSEGYTRVLPGRGGMPKGNYPERGITEVRATTPRGNRLYVAGTHWNTGYTLDRTPGPDSRREKGHTAQTSALIQHVVRGGQGRAVSFAGGDTNVDEAADTGYDRQAPHHLFTRARLRTVYDDAHEYPNTHGRRTYDVLLRNLRDRRVSFRDLHVWPLGFSDHRRVSARWWVRDPLLGVG